MTMDVFGSRAGRRSFLGRLAYGTLACMTLGQLAMLTLPGGHQSSQVQAVYFGFSIPVPQVLSNMLTPNNNNRRGNSNGRGRNSNSDSNFGNRNNNLDGRGRRDNNNNNGDDEYNYDDDNNNNSNGRGNNRSNERPNNNSNGSGRNRNNSNGSSGGGSKSSGNRPVIVQIGTIQGSGAKDVVREISKLNNNN